MEESVVDYRLVTDLALEAGRILLKNGGEVFRVDDTIQRICKSFRVSQVDVFITGHAIFISVENGAGDVYTKVKNVPLSSPNLKIVAEINALSREIASGEVSLSAAMDRLKEIETIPGRSHCHRILAAGISAGMFAVLLGGVIAEGVAAFIIGCLTYLWVLFAEKHRLSKIITNVVNGIAMTVFALIIIQIPGLSGLHMAGMLSGAIMPFIPGLAFVNAVRDIADSDFLSGTVRMIDALLVFIYIALGVGVTLGLYNGLLGGVFL